MNQVIDRLINLDTDNYYENHPDLQQAVNGMSEIDRKLWLLNHFIKHGYTEGRKYKLTRGMTIDEPQPHSRHDHKKKSKDEKKAKQDKEVKEAKQVKEDKVSDTDETDVQQLIQKFRHKYSHTKGGKRDKSGDKVAPPVAGRNVFWEISR